MSTQTALLQMNNSPDSLAVLPVLCQADLP
jgi:hypothetical protein